MIKRLTLLSSLLCIFPAVTFAQFAHVQGVLGTSTTAAMTITLPANPTPGNIVTIGIMGDKTGSTISSVKDSNNNAYTITPNSPSTFTTGAGLAWMVYLLSAPANATKTISVAFNQSPSAEYVAWAAEFSVTGGTAAFDKDAKANTSTASTTISTPTITPAGASELLFAAAAAGGTISAAGSPWTGATGAITNGDWAEHDLSASAATAVKFTQSSGGWSAMAMAFTFTPSAGATTKRLTTLGVGD